MILPESFKFPDAEARIEELDQIERVLRSRRNGDYSEEARLPIRLVMAERSDLWAILRHGKPETTYSRERLYLRIYGKKREPLQLEGLLNV